MESEISTHDAALLGGLLGAFGLGVILIAAVWYLLQVIAYWKIFKKAGKPGWHSIIPILNTWDEFDLSWSRTIAWVFIALMVATGLLSGTARAENASTFVKVIFGALGCVSTILAIVGQYKLAKAFGKGIGFFIGLLLLNPIFKMILGFGDARYQGPQG